ncbi:helix-turn-helix transcriptional regulator [Streptococcus dysgalactiae]|uniref:XRE family transcriptional regulator n=1 Tax=Streptococcus dysgalactiae subsp. dysgalactiae TaxID=99822 RepID=A0A9X7SB92_STRDY|nr:helix-turn-helix transcriptional regulator [Streptococcus dysgalactiae]QGH01408.1 XRE family transcriptional regulator [Streptococcus dysgalactiae subsp. dysgalactiae]
MKLKELRQAKGMTRVQLSKAIDVRVRTIAPWENGESDMFLKTSIMLSTYFNVTLDEFISL